MIGRFLALLTMLAAIALSPATAQTIPKLTGPVMDLADQLDPTQEAALDAKLRGYQSATQQQFVVVTLPDLEGYDISDWGYRMGNAWKLGDAERDDGLILIVAPKERRMRFEVGDGIEGVFPDAMAWTIIRDDITPRFKAGDIPGGIDAGVDAAIKQLQLTPEEAAARAAAADKAERDRADDGDIGGLIFVGFIVFFFFILPILSSIGRKGRRRRKNSPWGAPIIIWGDNDWGSGSGGSSWGGGGGSSWGGGGGGFGGFSGGGGSFGGGGASGGW
ncbi:MAG: TPM domain-containing protein [Sphingopyxis sp.]|uniref:TPM domain-containing protein n=1 Tax=Sphingopyxis sp. TaxID=1908224 RepID=UPI003D6CCA15